MKLRGKYGVNLKPGQTFFDAPMGSNVCSCGNKVVAQGRCQPCYDEFVREVRIERVRMHQENKKENARLEKLWKLFRSA